MLIARDSNPDMIQQATHIIHQDLFLFFIYAKWTRTSIHTPTISHSTPNGATGFCWMIHHPLHNSSSQPYTTTSIKYIMHFTQVSERCISKQHSQIFTSTYHSITQLSYDLKLSTHVVIDRFYIDTPIRKVISDSLLN